MSRPYTVSAAVLEQRRRAGRLGGRARLGYRKPNPALRTAADQQETKQRALYRAVLRRLHSNRRRSRALAEVGRFRPGRMNYADWWIRFNEAQRLPVDAERSRTGQRPSA